MIICSGQLEGNFAGFNNSDTVFKFRNGQKWRQAEYHYNYRYAYSPNARVEVHQGQTMLYVDGMTRPVRVVRE